MAKVIAVANQKGGVGKTALASNLSVGLAMNDKKVWWRCIQGHEWIAKIADRYYGSQCPYCEGHMLYKGFNDLASNYPELAKEWSEKNAPKRADEVFPKSRENVWWKCRVCGYEWRAVIDSRVKGSSCPVCSDRVVVAGVNDLATTDPELISEWDYDRNTMISPEQVHRNSLRIVWWIYSNVLMDFSNGIRVRSSDFRNFSKLGVFDIAVPDIDEQNRIVDFLDEKCNIIDSLVIDNENYINELKELKKLLIYEYTTGKKEVPHS